MLSLAILSLGMVAAFAAPGDALAQQTSPANGQSWTDKLSSFVKPKPAAKTPSTSKDDPISLQNNGKVGPELHVAVARYYMEQSRPADAEEHFKLALTLDPRNLAALLGYAQLQDQVGRPREALQLYQQAANLHPLQASVHNNMGLFCAKHGQPDEAIAALNRAIRLDPKNPRYRNNIAMVLVDQNRLREAFSQLRDVYKDAVAYYNLAYMLNKKGDTQGALQHFVLALRADPTMAPAERWIEYLHRTTAQARLPEHPMNVGVRIADDPARRRPVSYGPRNPSGDDPSFPGEPPVQPSPHRLPPPGASDPVPSLPGITYGPASPPAAPMPPPLNPAIRPLPRVE
ncbi:MAG: tetratricopeptide repeat protein, partial [Thermoguttaceae bacterium]